MSIVLAQTIHRFATDPQFRAQVQANPELIVPTSHALTAEDRAALLEVIEGALQHSAAQSFASLADGLDSNWPVNASFTSAAIA